jgi:hypothetical protein
MWTVEALAAGREARRRREATIGAFTQPIADRARQFLGDEAPPPLLAETAVGGSSRSSTAGCCAARPRS